MRPNLLPSKIGINWHSYNRNKKSYFGCSVAQSERYVITSLCALRVQFKLSHRIRSTLTSLRGWVGLREPTTKQLLHPARVRNDGKRQFELHPTLLISKFRIILAVEDINGTIMVKAMW